MTQESVSTVLVDIAEELFTFGVGAAGEVYAVPRDGPKVVRLLRGAKNSLRAQLAKEYWNETGTVAAQQALADALLVIEGMAQDGEQQPLHLRVAQDHDGLWLDLGDATGRAVCVGEGGWKIHDQAPMLFKRTGLTSALPTPVRGGSLDVLWRWLNVSEEDRPLVLAWLVAALYPAIPHPVLAFFGEQGTGKSTASRMLVSIVDPSPALLRKAPRDAEGWVTAASGSWIVGLDNLSTAPDWLSDSLCRAVTGDGDVRRKLYTDGDLTVFAFRRALVLNGIDLGALRGDLAERLLAINLDLISEEDRRSEEELWAGWTEVHPRLLGAVLTLAASVASVRPSVHLGSKPRMADFAELLAATDKALGTTGYDRYVDKQRDMATDSLSADRFLAEVAKRYPAPKGFNDTAAILHAAIPRPLEIAQLDKDWPRNAREVTARLKRQAPVLRKAGWQVSDDGGHNHLHSIRWTLIPPRSGEGP